MHVEVHFLLYADEILVRTWAEQSIKLVEDLLVSVKSMKD